MQKTSFAEMRCSLARGLDLIGDWWSPLIIRDLFLQVTRFDELVEDLGISRNLLATRLKSLTEKGIIERTPYQSHPPRYEYRLTSEWGDRWARPKEGSPILYVHASCGHRFRPTITCSECGEAVTAATVTGIAGPGGGSKAGTRVLARRLRKKAM